MNTGRGKFPAPPLNRASNLAQESLKTLPSQNQLSPLKSYLKQQNPTEKIAMLNNAPKDIILNEDTLGLFFDKLAESISMKPVKPKTSMPSTKQYMGPDASKAGTSQMITQNPIPR